MLVFAGALSGCGGGSSGDDANPMEGTRETRIITSRITGNSYPLSIYLPPASAGPRAGLPVLYMLDGESWFETAVNIAESTHRRIIIVGIQTAGQRSRDFVLANSCTANGGGQAAYFDFIRQELFPYVEGAIGGNPGERALFGHSHGGSFVFYALFSEAPGGKSFNAYLASDASISCMTATAYGWEQGYAAAFRELPARLHISYATSGNFGPNLDYAATVGRSNYERLVLASQAYSGTHGGIVPQVLTDGIGFAFAAGP